MHIACAHTRMLLHVYTHSCLTICLSVFESMYLFTRLLFVFLSYTGLYKCIQRGILISCDSVCLCPRLHRCLVMTEVTDTRDTANPQGESRPIASGYLASSDYAADVGGNDADAGGGAVRFDSSVSLNR